MIERAFGLLVQRWGIFWRPLRVDMQRIPLIITVACKLHNICIDRFGCETVAPHIGGPRDSDVQGGDDNALHYTDGSGMRRGVRSDLVRCPKRDSITRSQDLLIRGLQRFKEYKFIGQVQH